MVILNSFLILNSSSPCSTQLTVTCRMSSSNWRFIIIWRGFINHTLLITKLLNTRMSLYLEEARLTKALVKNHPTNGAQTNWLRLMFHQTRV